MEMKTTGTLYMVTERNGIDNYCKMFHKEQNARAFVERKTRNKTYNKIGNDFWQECGSICPHTFSIKAVYTYD